MVQNTINPNMAARLYAQNQSIGTPGGDGVKDMAGGASADGVTFSDFLEDTVQDAIDTVRTGETMSAKAVTGQADLTEVVQAVTEADLVVSTAKAMIDRMISSYQDIMRLPI